MDAKKKQQAVNLQEDVPSTLSKKDLIENVEFGENHQERIVDYTERHDSLGHECKGRHCDTAFEKL